MSTECFFREQAAEVERCRALLANRLRLVETERSDLEARLARLFKVLQKSDYTEQRGSPRATSKGSPR
jgi:hypothetical protein